MAATTRIIEDTLTNTNGGGSVASVAVGVGGSGYTSTPTAAITAPPAGGEQATATVAFAAGAVTAVTVTNSGSGYVVAPPVSITGGGGTSATATATLTASVPAEYKGNTTALVTFSNHGAAVTIDASTLLGGSNGTQGFQKYIINNIKWSTDQARAVTFTGTGSTAAITVAPGQGSFNTAIQNTTTQPGDATNADITITPAAGCDGYMYMELSKEAFV